MAIDWAKFQGVSANLIIVLQPYLPALQRSGEEILDGFILHFSRKDWAAVDALLYQSMTIPERDELDQQVLSGAREAAQAQFDTIELTKNMALKVLIQTLTLLI